jgi:tellurite resistance protein TerC
MAITDVSIVDLRWPLLVAAIATAFAIDLWLHRGSERRPSIKQAFVETLVWTAIGLSFAGVVAAVMGSGGAIDYVTGYTLEKSLSLDNVAVFAVIIASLRIPAANQRRLVDHAILAALVLRLGFIVGGLSVLDHAHAALYLFGVVLLVSGVRMLRAGPEGQASEAPRVLRLARWLPISDHPDGRRYFTRSGERRRRVATPLFLALLTLAVVDVVFAVDSVPAIFAVTSNAWIVCAANAFALLGMRPMYFLLAEGISRLAYLQRGLAVVLIGIGVEMLVGAWVAVPVAAILGFVLTVLIVSVGASLLWPPSEDDDNHEAQTRPARHLQRRRQHRPRSARDHRRSHREEGTPRRDHPRQGVRSAEEARAEVPRSKRDQSSLPPG